MTNRIQIISYDNRIRVFWILVAISILSLFTYMSAINITARNIAKRSNLENQITVKRNDLDTLEFKYIELKNNITADLASYYGFKEAKDPLYISRGSKTTFSFNTGQ